MTVRMLTARQIVATARIIDDKITGKANKNYRNLRARSRLLSLATLGLGSKLMIFQ